MPFRRLAMRIVVRPIVDPQREIDLTHRLESAIAEEGAGLVADHS